MDNNIFEIITFTDQSFLALIALIGATVFFRLQLVDKQIDLSLNAFRFFVKQKMLKSVLHSKWTDPDVDCWLEKDIGVHLRAFIAMENQINGPFFDALCDYYLIIKDLSDFRGNLITYTKYIVCFLLIPILIPKLSLILLFKNIFSFSASFFVIYLIASIIPCFIYFKFAFTDPGRRINNPETNKAFKGIDFSENTIMKIAEKRFDEKVGNLLISKDFDRSIWKGIIKKLNHKGALRNNSMDINICINVVIAGIALFAAFAAWKSADEAHQSAIIQQLELRPYITIQPTRVGWNNEKSLTFGYILTNIGKTPAIKILKGYNSYITKLIQPYRETPGQEDALAPSQISAEHLDNINIDSFNTQNPIEIRLELLITYEGINGIGIDRYCSKAIFILTPYKMPDGKFNFVVSQPKLAYGIAKEYW